MKFNPGNNFSYLNKIKPEGYSVDLHGSDNHTTLILSSREEERFFIKYFGDVIIIESFYKNIDETNRKVLDNNVRENAESLESLVNEFIEKTQK